MTFGDLQDALRTALLACTTPEEEVVLYKTKMRVFFDFPLDGTFVKYDIARVDAKGIMIKNMGVERE